MEHVKWWESLSTEEKTKVKVLFHKEYEFELVKDLTDGEIKLMYSRITKGLIACPY